MKKLLLALIALCLASSVFAQGTIVFNNRVTGSLFTRVYLGGTFQMAGDIDWSWATPLSGSGYSAALLAAPGADAPESLLLFQPGSVTTFRTGTAAGQVAGLTVTLINVPKDAPAATFQMVAWDNLGGTITTWEQALAAQMAPMGKSPVFTVNGIGGDVNSPPYLIGLKSFNIIPEPSTFALLALGTVALMIWRRPRLVVLR